VENAALLGDRLLRGLNEVGRKHEIFREARGKGLLVGVEFGEPKSPRIKMGWKLLHRLNPTLFCQVLLIPLLNEHQILAQVAGHHLDIIKLLPALVITDDDVDHIVRAFDEVMTSAERFPGPAWDMCKRLVSSAAAFA
jgi:ornithine--oxo-acid transaminase